MKPIQDQIMLLNSDFNPLLVQDHLDRMDDEYFATFGFEHVCQHLTMIHRLQEGELYQLQLTEKDQWVELCFTSLDFFGLHSILTGVLFLCGFSIQKGSYFCYTEPSRLMDLPKDQLAFIRKLKNVDALLLQAPQESVGLEELGNRVRQAMEKYLNLFHEKGMSEVRFRLHTEIGERFAHMGSAAIAKVYPIDIQFEPDPKYTVLTIKGQDTPAFLFTLTNALNLHGIMLQRMLINTIGNGVHDRLWLTNRQGLAITSPESLERLRSTVALIKQFSTFLPHASNYDSALRNFYSFLNSYLVDEEKRHQWMQVEPERLMALMAKVFGTGNFLWEEFTRMQVQHLLPMLRNVESLRRKKSRSKLVTEIDNLIEKEDDLEAQVNAVNRYKDEELFRLDLAHLVHIGVTFKDFSEQLTLLAEVSMSKILDLITRARWKNKGLPYQGSQDCGFVLVALGKFGGREIGYASDLEIGVIYDERDGDPFWQDLHDRLAKSLVKSFRAKNDGIFEIDLRLRPHGVDGPWAASLRRWVEYYQVGGAAHDIERQALTRLRPFYGDLRLTDEINKLRDQILYTGFVPNRKEFLRLRQSQIGSHVKNGTLNAKYSPGGLVDLEYTLQFLQLEHGQQVPELRNPNHQKVLESLLSKRLIRPTEFEKLYKAYAFHRRLINALRMVRGNAKDLELPTKNSEEWDFLARRLGYASDKKEHFERFEKEMSEHFRNVAIFYKSYFQPQEIAEEFHPGLPEIIMGEADLEQTEQILTSLGVEDYNKISQSLRRIYDMSLQKEALLGVLVQFSQHLELSPDPEGALLSFEKFLSNADEDPHVLQKLMYQPMAIEWLAVVFGQSQFLTDFLVNHPEVLLDLVENGELYSAKNLAQFRSEIQKLFQSEFDYEERLEKARFYRNREYLRIGLRDFYLGAPFSRLVAEISALSHALALEIYDLVFRHSEEWDLSQTQGVIAFGKLGGGELNYSSDIDIVFVTTRELSGDEKARLERLNIRFCKALSAMSRYGQLFRVDTTLRPYGQQGGLVASREHYLRYYDQEAQGWELQIWVKASVLCGDLDGGNLLIQEIRQHLFDPQRYQMIQDSVTYLRSKKIEILQKKSQLYREVKSGPAGIRTPEFLVQGLQVKYGRDNPGIITGNSWLALRALFNAGLIDKKARDDLSEHYIFLRTVEHRLQLYAMQQDHLLPESPAEFRKLALRMGYRPQLGQDASCLFRNDLIRTFEALLVYHHQIYPNLPISEPVDLR